MLISQETQVFPCMSRWYVFPCMSRWYEACMWGHFLPVFLPLFSYTLSCTLLPGSMVSAPAHERFCSCFDCVRSTMGCLSGSTRPPSTCWSWWTPTLHGGKDGCRSLREMLPFLIPLCQGILHSSGVKHMPLKMWFVVKNSLVLRLLPVQNERWNGH